MSVPVRTVAFAILGVVVGAAEPSAAASLAEFERKLTSAGKATRTLSGRFVQRKRLKLFKSEVVTRGRVDYERPDRLRWQTLAPDESTLVVAGGRAELRVPDQRPRVIDLKEARAVGLLVEQLLTWLGAGARGSLTRWYRVSVKKTAGYRLTLRPLARSRVLSKRIKEVRVAFGPDLLLKTIEIHHPGGDWSRIEFVEIQRNVKLPLDAFK